MYTAEGVRIQLRGYVIQLRGYVIQLRGASSYSLVH